MIVRTLDIRSFRCIRHFHIDFASGLNVLYGPNELGKSTMVEALRAAFLLPVNSRVAEDFVPWGTDETPMVEVEFESPVREAEGSDQHSTATKWRIKKSFGRGRNQSAVLERIAGNGRAVEKARGRDVDGQLRSLLDWGIQEPGGRAAPRGWPLSYLTTALLGEQDGVAKVFESSLDSDSTESGRKWLTAALGVLAQAPEVTEILARLTLRTREVFTDNGQKRRTQDSPLVKLTERKRIQQKVVEQLEEEERKSEEIESQLSGLRIAQQRVDADVTNLTDQVTLLAKVLDNRRVVSDSESRKRKLKEATEAYQQAESRLKVALLRRQKAHEDLKTAEKALGRITTLLAGLEAKLKHLNDTRGEMLESRRQQLEAARRSARQSVIDAQRVIDAACEVEQLRKDVADAIQKKRDSQVSRQQAAFVLQRAYIESIQQAKEQLATAESLTTLARLKATRDQLKESTSAWITAEMELDRLNEEVKQTDDRVITLKSEQADLRRARNESHDAEKRAWERRQNRHEQRRLLDDELRRAEDSERKARRFLDDLDQFDESTNRLAATKSKQSGLTLDREAADHSLSHLADELGAVAAGVLRWQLSAIACVILSFSILILAVRLDRHRAVLLSAFTALGTAAYILWLRWRRESKHRVGLTTERDAIQQRLVRLASQGLIADSEVDAAQREFDTRKRSLPKEIFERFDNFSAARAWLERKLQETTETQSRVKAEVGKLEKIPVEPDVQGVEGSATATLDAKIQKLSAHISVAEDAARTLRTQRDQAQVRFDQAFKDAFKGELISSNIAETHLQVLDSRISQLLQELEWPDDQIILTVEESEQAEMMASQTLISRTSVYDSRLKALNIDLSLDSQDEVAETIQLAKAPFVSIEEADQRLRNAKTYEAKCTDALKLREAELDARRSSADRLAGELEKPAEEMLNEANEVLARVDAQISELKSGGDGDVQVATSDRDAAFEEVSKQQEMVMMLYDNLRVIDDEIANLQEARESAKTARDKMEEHARHINAEEVASEMISNEQKLARVFPGLEVSVEQLERSRCLCKSAVNEQQRVRQSLHEARGKLDLSGGEVLRDRLESARAELERIDAEALDKELEYDAMYHLQQALQDASLRHSAHLGKSLAQPVSAEFRELTGCRYAEVHFDSDLQLKMVTAKQSERSREAMSVGARHQLATLIRLSLAAQLQTTVVLDDQLVHSDTQRLFWFRERLRQLVSQNPLQVIVVTCRPHDYVSEEELNLSEAGGAGANDERVNIIRVDRCLS